jgi:arylsulfate sulfotransferase
VRAKRFHLHLHLLGGRDLLRHSTVASAQGVRQFCLTSGILEWKIHLFVTIRCGADECPAKNWNSQTRRTEHRSVGPFNSRHGKECAVKQDWKTPSCGQRLSRKLAWLTLLCVPTVFLIACGGTASSDSKPTIQQTSVTATSNPLVAQYSVTMSDAATVSVEFGPTTSYGFQTSAQSTVGGTANVLVAGMKQNTLYHMRAVMNSAGGEVMDTDHTFQTGAIPPAMIPQMQITNPAGQQPTPGVQLVSGTGEEFALDTAGNIIWYYQNLPGGYPYLVKLLPNGHMLMVLQYPNSDSGLREVDLAGNIIRQIDLSQLGDKLKSAGYNLQLYSIDHDVLLMPNGHWLLIATDQRVFTDLPGYPGQTTVLGNAIIDLDQSNNVHWVWDAFDHLDVNRHPINFPDWTHANALFYIPDDGSVLLSLRHQHWVLKIDYDNGSGAGDIIWKLGYQGDFTLNSDSPADWFYAQHDANIASPNLTGDFQLALFDNGDSRVLDDSGDTCGATGQPGCYSTGALFDVNETTMSAAREWSYQMPYSFWGGSTELLGDSNLFISETAPVDLPNGSRILEVTQQGTLVWELDLNGINSYRALHMGSLYPGLQW